MNVQRRSASSLVMRTILIRLVPFLADVVNSTLALGRHEALAVEVLDVLHEAEILRCALNDGQMHEQLPKRQDRGRVSVRCNRPPGLAVQAVYPRRQLCYGSSWERAGGLALPLKVRGPVAVLDSVRFTLMPTTRSTAASLLVACAGALRTTLARRPARAA